MAKVVVITGASRGLGARMSKVLADDGYEVWGISRTKPNSDMIWYEGNVLDVNVWRKVLTDLLDREKQLAAVIFCAGINQRTCYYEPTILPSVSTALLNRILRTNIVGVHAGVSELYQYMSNRGGNLIFIGSDAAHRYIPQKGPYCVSKAALETYANVLLHELWNSPINVFHVTPGGPVAETGMTEHYKPTQHSKALPVTVMDDIIKLLVARPPFSGSCTSILAHVHGGWYGTQADSQRHLKMPEVSLSEQGKGNSQG